MEDQFGGRTDDDLFYDDVEPVTVDTSPPPPEIPTPSPPSAPLSEPTPSQDAPVQKPSGGQSPVVPAPSQPPPGNSLASSRWAGPPADPPRPAPAPAPQPGPGPGARDKKRHPSQNLAASAESRLRSGANPRQKLTEAELAAKMERMKLVAAEKTRKFEMAEKDQQQHAEAYARGMEEARKRRAQEAERRRRLDEEKRKLDEERARNRERKLKAMGLKDGGWDEGKEALAEDRSRAPFRSANGGIRGSRGSARPGRELDVDRFLNDRRPIPESARRARPGPGRPPAEKKPQAPAAAAPALTVDQFPALPTEAAVKKAPEKADSTAESLAPKPLAAALVAPVPAPPTPPAGPKWDDEMAALDAAGSGPA